MCFGYGTSREILVLCDVSGSMTSSGENDFEWIQFETDFDPENSGVFSQDGGTSVPYHGRTCLGVFSEIAARAECRCPRWGFAGYLAGGALVINGKRFARGIDAVRNLHLTDFDFFAGEDPLYTLDKIADMWGEWSPRNDEISTGFIYAVSTSPEREIPVIDPETGEQEIDEDGVPVTELSDYVHMGGKPLGKKSRPPRRIILWIADEPSVEVVGEGEEAEVQPRDPAGTIAKLQAAEITVIGFNVHGDDRFGLNEQMSAICEETGGEMFTDIKNRVGMIERFVGGPNPTDYGYRWIDPPNEDFRQKRKDFIDEVVETIHRYGWRDVGYPYLV